MTYFNVYNYGIEEPISPDILESFTTQEIDDLINAYVHAPSSPLAQTDGSISNSSEKKSEEAHAELYNDLKILEEYTKTIQDLKEKEITPSYNEPYQQPSLSPDKSKNNELIDLTLNSEKPQKQHNHFSTSTTSHEYYYSTFEESKYRDQQKVNYYSRFKGLEALDQQTVEANIKHYGTGKWRGEKKALQAINRKNKQINAQLVAASAQTQSTEIQPAQKKQRTYQKKDYGALKGLDITNFHL